MIDGLKEIAVTVMRRLEKSNTSGRTVTLKVKYADYRQVTRSRTLLHSIKSIDELMAVAGDLLQSTEADTLSVRLLGLSISNLDSEREQAESSEYQQLTFNFS